MIGLDTGSTIEFARLIGSPFVARLFTPPFASLGQTEI